MTTASAEDTATREPGVSAPDSSGYVSVDPNQNPALAQQLANQAMHGEDDQPVVAKRPPKETVELPGGWVDSNGILHKTARIRELTGRDEERMTGPAVTSPIQIIDTVVHNCLVDIDGQKLTSNEIDHLLIGDREAVFIGVRIATYGASLLMPVICRFCDSEFEVRVDLESEVAVKELPGDPKERLRTVDLPTGGKAEVNLMTGAAQKAAYGPANLTDIERYNIMVRESLFRINGQLVTTLDEVRDMNANDLRFLRRYLEENTCGPRWWEVKQECPRCQKTDDLPISLVALFQ